MDDGADAADLRCFDKTCPQQRYRNIGEVEIEQNARRHEERARQKFAKVPVTPGEIEGRDGICNCKSYVKGNDHALFLLSPFVVIGDKSRWWQVWPLEFIVGKLDRGAAFRCVGPARLAKSAL